MKLFSEGLRREDFDGMPVWWTSEDWHLGSCYCPGDDENAADTSDELLVLCHVELATGEARDAVLIFFGRIPILSPFSSDGKVNWKGLSLDGEPGAELPPGLEPSHFPLRIRVAAGVQPYLSWMPIDQEVLMESPGSPCKILKGRPWDLATEVPGESTDLPDDMDETR